MKRCPECQDGQKEIHDAWICYFKLSEAIRDMAHWIDPTRGEMNTAQAIRTHDKLSVLMGELAAALDVAAKKELKRG